jgi:hypothetical protein
MEIEAPLGTPDDAMAAPSTVVDQDRIYGQGFILEQIMNFLVGEPGPPAESRVWGSGIMVNREFGLGELFFEGMIGIVDEINGVFPLFFQVAKAAGAIAL